MKEKADDYFACAARTVELQAMQDSGIGVPVDPDVADHMGAFEEPALSLDDLADDPEASHG